MLKLKIGLEQCCKEESCDYLEGTEDNSGVDKTQLISDLEERLVARIGKTTVARISRSIEFVARDESQQMSPVHAQDDDDLGNNFNLFCDEDTETVNEFE